MIWTSIYVKNFMSIEEARLELDKRGLMLIEGRNKTNGAFKSNGSGKTSILDSIVYAIYDTTSKGLKADAVVSRAAKKNTEVILEGKKGDDVIRIERYRKHKTHKNKVRLLLNGKDISEKSAKATNEAIESIVGIDYKTFINSIMFSQGTGAGRFATATDKEKKEILENLVNLNIYANAQEIAKEKVKEKQEEINENIRGTERLNWELSNVDLMEQQEQENYENTRSMIKQEQDNLEANIKEMSKYTQDNFPVTEQLKEEIVALENQRDSHTSLDISAISNEVNTKYRELTEKVNNQKNLTAKKDEIVGQYKRLQTETNCPVCGNLLDQAHREQEMNSLKEQLRDILVELSPLEGVIAALTEEYNNLHKEYQEHKALYDNANANYQKIVNTIQQKKDQIANYENTLQGYQTRMENIKSTLEKLNNVPKPRKRDDERKGIKEKITAQKQALLDLEKEKKQLEDMVKVYSNSGVKSHVLDLITPYLNKRANTYLRKLSGSDIEVRFDTQKKNKDGTYSDKFDVQVFNSTGGESYQANSEGEKKRIDLAISLAIQDLVLKRSEISTNIVIYDEVFDALDSVGAENVVELLKERLDTVDSIFVVTHNEHLKPLFEQVITVVKYDKWKSKVVEGIETS